MMVVENFLSINFLYARLLKASKFCLKMQSIRLFSHQKARFLLRLAWCIFLMKIKEFLRLTIEGAFQHFYGYQRTNKSHTYVEANENCPLKYSDRNYIIYGRLGLMMVEAYIGKKWWFLMLDFFLLFLKFHEISINKPNRNIGASDQLSSISVKRWRWERT